MTTQEYNQKMKALQTKYENDKKELAIAYAKANNPYSIGDIVTDHIGSLRIQKIKYSTISGRSGYPCCVYFGIELKKDGTPKKNQEGRGVYQSNLNLTTP